MQSSDENPRFPEDRSRNSTLALLVRHHKERLAKCTLEPLRDDPRFEFRCWRPGTRIDAASYLILDHDAPELTPDDPGPPIVLLDATWRHLAAMRAALVGTGPRRSLPRTLATAYPRRSKLFDDPKHGLASIEALYAALRILGYRDDALLSGYRWRERFLANCERAGLP